MKSITQEASTIAKAIEQGWQKAGKPQTFSVKIFEQPEHNFFGMVTKRSAKVGIFFEDEVRQEQRTDRRSQSPRKERVERPARQGQQPQRQPQESRNQDTRQREHTKRSPQSSEQIHQSERPERTSHREAAEPSTAPHEPREYWTPEMLALADKWLKTSLRTMNCAATSFTLTPANYHLKVLFSQPLDANEQQEKSILRNFALLLLQALRHEFKRPLRGFKIVLTSQR